MTSTQAGFDSLPPEFRELIRLAERQHNITITPLQALGGGWSGARLFLVSVASPGTQALQHLILKLDQKSGHARADELERHSQVLALSPAAFAERRLPRLAYERVEHAGRVAIFYAIAGQSLHHYRPLARFEAQNEIETIFAETYRQVLDEWNPAPEFRQALPPASLLETWLAFRVKPGSHVDRFLAESARVSPDLPGFLVRGSVYPNPLAFIRRPEWWAGARPIDAAFGLMHGDLNTGNILVQLSPAGALDGFFLIDFALFKDQMPLLYDLRYLEMSYLILRQEQISPPDLASLVINLASADPREPQRAPVALSGLYGVLAAARRAFAGWVDQRYPSLSDDLWGQYCLAGAAAGLAFCHKPALSDRERLLGLLYGAANLKLYLALFGLPLPSEARELMSAESGPAAAAAPRATPHNLPAETTRLVGREAETEAVRQLLAGARLVTLTGPGGTGKTRLSLHLAEAVLDDFPGGVYFVALADLRDPAQVLAQIAQALGIREGSQPLMESLTRQLHGQSVLLVLDNFEHVLPAAEQMGGLLAALPRLKLLVTSRAPLRLRGEHEFPVPPLGLPPAPEAAAPDEIGQSEAVRLFVERARAALPSFDLTPGNAASVAAICLRLDGLPLALELAAARVRLLPPAALLERLGRSLAVLTGGARDLPARHQALRRTLDWSHDLLAPAEQTLFARLGVFVGGFDLDALEAVCNPGGELDVLEGLSALVENSLVQPSAGEASRPRYRMLETIREYALERLDAAGQAEGLRRAHALYYEGQITGGVGDTLFAAASTLSLNWIDAEYGNVRAALDWRLEHAEDQERLSAAVLVLGWYWYRRGRVAEGRQVSDRILQATSGRTPGRAMALQNYAMLSMWQGELNLAHDLGKESVLHWQALEDERGLPMALMNLGVVLVNMGRDQEAHPALVEAEALFEELGPIVGQNITRVHLANVALGLGKVDEAAGWLKKALASAREIGEPWTISFALNNLGEVARVRGDYAAARRYYAESEAILRSTGDHGDLARLIHSQGYTDLHAGDLAGAEARFAESLAMFQRLSNKRGLAECLAGLAAVRARQDRPERAARLLAAGETLLTQWGAAWWPADRVEVERLRASLQAALGQEAFAAAWAAGQRLEPEQALALAAAHGE